MIPLVDFAESAARNEEVFRSINERIDRGATQHVVLPGHENSEVEQVVAVQTGYLVVEKIGEARVRLERDHPQQCHRP
jgi:hypothetical protein